MENITKLDNYELRKLRFDKKEALVFPQDMEHRREQIDRAVALGRNFGTTSRITFEANGEVLETEAIMWVATDSWIILKNDLLIPIRSIREVEV